MKWLINSAKIRLVLVVFVVAIVLSGGGNANGDFIFGEPTALEATINRGDNPVFDCISADGLELYLEKPIGGVASSNWDLYVSTRPTTNDPWSVPVSLGPTVNSSYLDVYACLSSDSLELYFCSRRPDGYGQQDIWLTTRPYKGADWGIPMNLGPTINTSGLEQTPWITPDGLELYFISNRPGGSGDTDIWVSQRASSNDPWQTPVNLGPVVNSTVADCYPCLSPDGLILFFSDYDLPTGPYRPGGLGRSDMWMTRRKSTADPWEPPVNLGPELNTSSWDSEPRVSPDGSVLYFNSTRPGGPGSLYNIWQASIIPIVDFNGDGIVDSADMCIMVDHWGTDEPLCDIGPTPFGDGIIDVQDLIVLAEHLFEETGLVAYWKLDETEGEIAHDTANGCDGTLQREPTWQPEIGMVDGALEFDGTDDYVSTPFILNPAEGPFSVFAWIKGGAPGQAVLSQIGGVNWLCADTLEGNLMTELKATSRGAAALLSQTIITDGDWHRIGLVWDGSNRTLYVDDVAVVEDTQANLEGSDNGLYIGTGKAMETETYFSGLIDDIRIYNRALIP